MPCHAVSQRSACAATRRIAVVAAFAAGVAALVLAAPARSQPARMSPAGAPLLNAHDFYVRAGRTIAQPNPNDLADAVARPKPGSAAGVGAARRFSLHDKEALLTRNAKALRILRQGFVHRYRQPPARSTEDTSLYAAFTSLRYLTRLLVLEAQVKTARGHRGSAADSLLDAMRVGLDAPRGAPLIGMLVGHFCQTLARREIWHLLNQLDAVSARRATRRLEALLAGSVSYADTLRGEKRFGQMARREMMRRPNWRATWLEDQEWDSPLQQNAAHLQLQLFSDQFIADSYNRYMDALIAEAQQPYAVRAPVPPPADPVNQHTAEIFGDQTWLTEVKNRAHNALLLAALALRAHKLEHGSYPPTLKQLTPVYIGQIPADPFSFAGPLRYKRAGGQYLVYSVGPDGKDDGGRPIGGQLLGGERNITQPQSKGDITVKSGATSVRFRP